MWKKLLQMPARGILILYESAIAIEWHRVRNYFSGLPPTGLSNPNIANPVAILPENQQYVFNSTKPCRLQSH